VARLILLNGPPGSGKSTLAGLYVEDHVLALNLDIDRVRDLLGRWREQPMQAGLLTRAMCLAMAHTHLGAGHDVVIPQYVAEVAFLQKVEQVATDAGAAFHEIALLDSRDNALRRFLTRAARTGLPAHTDAHDQLQRAGGPPVLERMYDRLLEILADRPKVHVIRTEQGRPDDAYQALLRHVRSPRR